MQNGAKPSSRFSTLNVFKLKSGAVDTVPPPPPKDLPNPSLYPPPHAFYNKSLFSRSAASLSPLTPDSHSGPATPATPYPPMPSACFEFGKRSNSTLASPGGRAAAGSPAPSASGGSLRSVGRGGADYLSMDGSTDSSGSSQNPSPNTSVGVYMMNGANSSSYTMGAASVKQKKSVFRLANLAKRNRSKKDLSDTASASGSLSSSTNVSEHDHVTARQDSDEGISLPWNFQHHIHVDEGYIGLPPSWSAALSQSGFDEDEIAAIHARRRAAATATLASNTKSSNPHTTYSIERSSSPRSSPMALPTISTSSSATLFDPLPRSTSLGKGRETLKIYPPSLYLDTTSTGGGPFTVGGPSPAPSPHAPSFSMKSFVSGVKNSLTTDSASMKEGVGGTRVGAGAVCEESEQYVFVDGDGPQEDGDQGTGDETLIDSCRFDTASVSSHQTHNSRMRTLSQGQETPRTPTFPQIHVQRTRSDSGHVPYPSRAPSPLAHSTSLPIPASPHGYTLNNHSTPSLSLSPAGSRPGPVSAPPRTTPRRIYHVVNVSSDSSDEEKYAEPPPAYVSPKKEWIPKEKDGSGISGGPPPPSRPIPPTPTGESFGIGEPSGVITQESRVVSTPESSDDMTDLSANDIPGSADDVLDISSYYSDIPVHERDTEMDSTQQERMSSPTPPLVIDKRMSKLAAMPPRISLHQEGSLEDWSESLFDVIGKRSSVVGRVAASVKKERRTTIRPMLPLSIADENEDALASNSSSPDPVVPSLSDISSGTNLTLGPHARGTVDAIEERDEQDQGEEEEVEEIGDVPEEDTEEQAAEVDKTTTAEEEAKEADGSPAVPSTPVLPDMSHCPNVDYPVSTSSSSSESQSEVNMNTLPPPPPPKPKPKPAPLVLPPTISLAPPRTNVITGISGKSPVNSLFNAKPQPLPIPIPPSQIRAQLRPAPPKPPHPPPTLPLPPLKRIPSQPNLPPAAQSLLPPLPSPTHGSTTSHASPLGSRPNSSQTLLPVRENPGDRDSGLSTITVTPATIATARVVRTAIASVVDRDTVSAVSTVNAESQSSVDANPNMGRESPRTKEKGEAPDDSTISETSSVSLLRDGPQSKWPAPPPPPIELETDSTPRRISRFRTTSLVRVTQLQALNLAAIASPMSSHFSHGSSDTTSSSTSESVPLTIPKGVNGVSPSTASKTMVGLAPEAKLLTSTSDTFGGIDVETESGEESEARSHPSETPLSESHSSTPSSTHPLLTQLKSHISSRNPLSCFTNLVEIAEGESGSVFAARVVSSFVNRTHGLQGSTERPIPPGTSLVAIKRIPLPPIASSPTLSDNSSVSNKLVSVLHELSLLKNLDHEHLLLLDAVYVGSNSGQAEDAESASAVDTSLWIRMELMERSLADVIGLVAEGLVMQERLVGRFASDILHGLDYLQRQHIAHRDVRSDNLLVNATGVVKLADFSNAIRVDRNAPTVNGAVGVIYWQAPEMRAGPYNTLKVDVWSLGATVWELAETVPPFSMPASPSTQVSFAIQSARHVGSHWPPLTHPEHYSRAFHEFLRLCGRDSAGRPGPGELLNTPFIRNACGRAVILQLLSQCRAIEETMAAREASVGQS